MADSDGNPNTTHTTVIRESSGGGGAGWLIAIVLLIAVGAGIYFVSRGQDSTVAKNDAIAGAAKDVGSAANKVGDAVEPGASK